MEKYTIFNTWCWINWRSACRKMQVNSFLFPCTKLKYKWFKDIQIKADTLKHIEKVGKNVEYMGTGEDFLNRTTMYYALRTRIDK